MASLIHAASVKDSGSYDRASRSYSLLPQAACLILLLLIGTDALSIVLGTDNLITKAIKGIGYLGVVSVCLVYPRVLASALGSVPWLTALLLLACVSFFWSINPDETQRRLPSIVATTLLGMLIGRALSLRGMIVFFASFAVVLVVANFLAIAFAPAARGAPPWDDVWRGIFNHKNGLGSACAIVLPFVAYAALTSERQGRRAVFMAGTIGVGVLLAVSSSRTAQIVGTYALLNLGLVLVLRDRLITWSMATVGLLLGGAALAAMLVATGVADAVFRALGRRPTMSGRIPIWEHVWPWIEQQPYLGYGYSGFWDPESFRVTSMVHDIEIRYAPWYSHNGMIETLLNTGLVGFTIVILIILQAFRAVFRVLRSRPQAFDVTVLHVVLLSFCVQNVAESNILARDDLIWIIFVASVTRLTVLERAARRDFEAAVPDWRDFRLRWPRSRAGVVD